MTEIAATTEIYREINDDNLKLLEWLDRRNQLDKITRDNGDVHYFVSNEVPRDTEITPQILEVTVGFALFTDDGEYVGSYKKLAGAIDAQAGARIVVRAEVDGVEPDEVITDNA